MATVTGLTAARMLEIEAASIVDGEIVSGNLILEKHDGSTIDAGSVEGPVGPVGPAGPAGGLIPGEVRLWPGDELPLLATYGLWDWCNGGVLVIEDYPIAAGHIADGWRTFGGASDPGVLNFRKPDLRGVVPAGLDQMPGDGARANRMTRAVAIILAGKTGEETHVITLPESPSHNHGGGVHAHSIADPGHVHWIRRQVHGFTGGGVNYSHLESGGGGEELYYTNGGAPVYTGISIANSAAIIAANGGGGGHETVQPTVMVPYIVKLDD